MIRHDYPEINRWLKNLYWKNPAFKDTTEFNHIKVSCGCSRIFTARLNRIAL
jgi:putative glutathione S-transferase